MTRRGIALALALLLLLTACGGRSGKAGNSGGDAADISFPPGYYEVSAKEDGKVGYLKASYSRLIFYDNAGDELESLLYDIAGNVIYAEGAELYTLSEKKGEFLLKRADGPEYALQYLSADLLPEDGYAVYEGESNEKLGYLRAASGQLVFFDRDGNELERYNYRVSDDGEVTSDGRPLYTAYYGRGGLRLRSAAGREYILVASTGAPAYEPPAETAEETEKK